MLVMGEFCFGGAYFYSGIKDFSIYYKLDIFGAAFGLMIFPFIHLYFRTLTDESPLGWKEYSWFLPGLLVGASSAILCILMGDEQAANYMRTLVAGYEYPNQGEFNAPIYQMHYLINFVFYYIILLVQIILAMIYNITNFKIYRKRLNDFLSNSDDVSLQSMISMFKGIIALLIAYLLLIALAIPSIQQKYQYLLYFLSIVFAAILYFLTYHVLNINYTSRVLAADLQHLDEEVAEKGYLTIVDVNKSTPSIKKEKRKEILSKLNSLMNEDKIFLKNDLRMDDIVRLTEVNRTYISVLIGEEYQCTFSELINQKRIEYAKQLALKDPNLSHVQIAEQSGFSHASSFSRTFKQYVGMTFREWYRIH